MRLGKSIETTIEAEEDVEEYILSLSPTSTRLAIRAAEYLF